MKLVFKLSPPYAGSSLACASWVSSLNHKVLDISGMEWKIKDCGMKYVLLWDGDVHIPVKQTVIVVPTSTESQEILWNKNCINDSYFWRVNVIKRQLYSNLLS